MKELNEIKNYNPRNDFIFKKVMETDNGKIAKYITDVILNHYGFEKTINYEIITNKMLPREHQNEKIRKVDFIAKDGYNRKFIIEMQQQNNYYFNIRSQGYLDKLFSLSVDKEGYKNVNTHFLISFINFDFCKDKNYNQNFNISSRTNSKCKYMGLKETIVISIENFLKYEKININNKLHQILIYFNKNELKKEFQEVKKMNPIINEADQIALKTFEDPYEELAYWAAQQREKAEQAEKELYTDKL
ncbi:MAG: Rpn family recombination-promoting nuclease/putative transposase, partial [Methanobrevibacter sp.]|nr:Rpn family recombination-promoting nuclease/putative transposase [Candidatus Methanoflexus mossambicus]